LATARHSLDCTHPARAAGPTGIREAALEIVEFQGFKRNVRLAGPRAELIATLDVGPRILHLALPGRPNVFKVYPDQMGRSGEAAWQIRGGHRLWVAPENTETTQIPDNGPVELEELPRGGVRLRSAPETATGIQKEIDIYPRARGPVARIVHRLRNVGPAPVRLAAWALSVMAPGGTAVVGLPPRGTHPEALLPNQSLVLWPYTDLADPRLRLGTRAILLHQRPAAPPFKLGLLNLEGWAAYAVHGCLFLKRFPLKPKKAYPDFGCNTELFTNADMLEVESLGPMVRLQPGRKVEHVEDWFLFADVPSLAGEADVDAFVRPLVERVV